MVSTQRARRGRRPHGRGHCSNRWPLATMMAPALLLYLSCESVARLSRVLGDKMPHPTQPKVLVIVARDRVDIWKHFRQMFAHDPTVEVILDRRSIPSEQNARNARAPRLTDRRSCFPSDYDVPSREYVIVRRQAIHAHERHVPDTYRHAGLGV